MSEFISQQEKFDLHSLREIERKFAPVYPTELLSFMSHESATAIEQVYLSSPDEPFSLRLRSMTNSSGNHYEATLKDRGALMGDGLQRLEVTTPISAELYDFYAPDAPARLRKIRVEPVPAVTVDFYEDSSIQIESEDQNSWREFTEAHDIVLREVTGHPVGDNEQRAYQGISYELSPGISVEQTIDEILKKMPSASAPTVVHIGGRSGSGKSTIVRSIMHELSVRGITSDVLSTDDYHRGQSWLTHYNNGEPWMHWDEPVVYDTHAMSTDLHTLRQGQSIRRRTIDWHTVEPHYGSPFPPVEVFIIEGIYALAPEITHQDDIMVELPTPLATCIGRRLLRDLKERPQFADPSTSLHYMLNEVEPAYRRQRNLTAVDTRA